MPLGGKQEGTEGKMRQRFFSLIELLMIVSILAILISLLLPASARTFIFNWLLIVFKIRFDTLVCSLLKLTRQDKSLKSNPFPSLKRKF